MKTGEIQPMDLTSLCAVLEDLRNNMVPSRFEKAQQPNKFTLQIALRTLKGLRWIETSWSAESSRLVEIPPPIKAGEESTLARQFNNILKKMALLEIKQEGFERVVELKFAERPGGDIQRRIMLEIMGRHSNIILLDEGMKVITMGRQVRSFHSRIRPISTGDKYIAPPPLKGIRPSPEESYERWKDRLCLISMSLKNSIKQTYQGISPNLLIQLASDTREKSLSILESNITDIKEEDWENIYQRWRFWNTAIYNKKFILSFNKTTPFQVWDKESPEPSASKDIALKLGLYYRDIINSQKLESLRLEIKRKLSSLKSTEEAQLKGQEALLINTEEISRVKSKADKILSSFNPTKGEIAKAQKLYSKVKKLRRSAPLIKDRISYHKLRIINIEETELYIESIMSSELESSSDKIKGLSELIEETNDSFKSKSNQKRLKSLKKSTKATPLELISPNGLKIQIGRNHRQNEFISINQSRDGDLWFHAQECPGSHVILKSSNGIAEEKDIQIAADLAALYSRAKGNKVVPIFLVQASKLKRVAGQLPGTVIHKGGEVIWGEPLKALAYIKNR